MAAPTASSSRSNRRASLALIVALCGALTVPAAIVVGWQKANVGLLDAAWGVPLAMALSVLALVLARAGRAHLSLTLERAGGRRRLRASRWIAVAGICLALSGAIAVGFYELLLRLEK